MWPSWWGWKRGGTSKTEPVWVGLDCAECLLLIWILVSGDGGSPLWTTGFTTTHPKPHLLPICCGEKVSKPTLTKQIWGLWPPPQTQPELISSTAAEFGFPYESITLLQPCLLLPRPKIIRQLVPPLSYLSLVSGGLAYCPSFHQEAYPGRWVLVVSEKQSLFCTLYYNGQSPSMILTRFEPLIVSIPHLLKGSALLTISSRFLN